MAHPFLNPAMLERFYKPMGREIPQEKWYLILINSSWDVKGSNVVVHVVLREGDRFAFVRNKKDVREREKRRGVGIPTKEVVNGETPFQAAQRAVKSELKMTSDFQISERPLSIRENSRNVTHVIFAGKAVFPKADLKEVEEEGGEVKEAIFVNPFEAIVIRRKRSRGQFEYEPVLRERFVYKSHLGIISLFLKMSSQGTLPD